MNATIQNYRTRSNIAQLGSRWLAQIGLVVVVVLFSLATPQPASAACDPRDLADAVVVSLETTAVCQPVCEDKYRCYAAAILGGALTVVANREGQDRVNLFCSKAQGKANEVIAQVQDVLKNQYAQEQLGEISGYLNTYAQDAQQVIAIVKCACETERLNIKNQSSFGACANEMLHGVGCGSIDFTTGVIESCTPGGKLIQEFFDSSWAGVKKIGCGSNMTSWMFDCGVGGTAGPRTTKCYAGYQSDLNGVCRSCQQTTHGITLKSGRCGCEPAFTPHYTVRSGIPILVACTCAPPYQKVGEQCLCPPNMQNKDGACVPCMDYEKYVPPGKLNGVVQMPSCRSCELGYRQSKADPTQCQPGWACDPKVGEVPDPNANGKKCLRCTARQRVVADMPIYQYRCEDCAKGQRASSDHVRCVPECPPGLISNTAVTFVGIGKTPQACIACAPGEHAVYDQPGSSMGRCELMSSASLPVAKKDCVALGVNYINDPENASRCVRCPGDGRANEARNACVGARDGATLSPALKDMQQPKRRTDLGTVPRP